VEVGCVVGVETGRIDRRRWRGSLPDNVTDCLPDVFSAYFTQIGISQSAGVEGGDCKTDPLGEGISAL